MGFRCGYSLVTTAWSDELCPKSEQGGTIYGNRAEKHAELDHYWERLGEGGDPAAQQCGWLKDKFGVSWQVVLTGMGELMSDPDPAVAERVMAAFLPMKKLVIVDLENAARG